MICPKFEILGVPPSPNWVRPSRIFSQPNALASLGLYDMDCSFRWSGSRVCIVTSQLYVYTFQTEESQTNIRFKSSHESNVIECSQKIGNKIGFSSAYKRNTNPSPSDQVAIAITPNLTGLYTGGQGGHGEIRGPDYHIRGDPYYFGEILKFGALPPLAENWVLPPVVESCLRACSLPMWRDFDAPVKTLRNYDLQPLLSDIVYIQANHKSRPSLHEPLKHDWERGDGL